MATIKLRIEHGQLLKPYTVPFDGRTGKHRTPPPGWTPLHDQWTLDKAEQIKAESPEPLPDLVVLRAAELANVARLTEARQPIPGWVMVSMERSDRHIRKAYRNLFIELGEWPPDGDYVLERGKMRSANQP